MNPRFIALLSVLVAFTGYSLVVIAEHGYTGFLTLAWSEAWAGQMLIDLVIALTLFLNWMLRDAREQQIRSWPYVALILTTGSIGALAYLVHRSAKSIQKPVPATR